MTLLSARSLALSYGPTLLLDRISFRLSRGERVALLGRNGAGKSSLLSVIAGHSTADAGELEFGPAVRVAMLEQDVAASLGGSVASIIAGGAKVARIDGIRALDADDPSATGRRVSAIISRMSLPGGADFRSLSGGLKRRILLARSLLCEPELLLLDEPTNHLDIESIEWLERQMLAHCGCVLYTTHDRHFLERTATRIIALDRGALSSWPGDYANYLRRRDEILAVETRADAQFDRKLAEEELWIRQGIKARRTRNEGRVRRLRELREQRAERQAAPGRVRLSARVADPSGRIVFDVREVGFAYGGDPLVSGFSTIVQRGDRVGVIGPHGAGKTTLLRLLLGDLEPNRGEIRRGTRLEVAYFDQHRVELRLDQSVQDNVADGADFIRGAGGGGRSGGRHVISYLRDFLFTASQARGPAGNLSGGERNRLLLARLFAKPSNLIVMDEPTNDLDLETLELLEEHLSRYPGTLIIVSHDRAFLDNVVTSIIAMEGGGRVSECVGGYSDWFRHRPPPPEPVKPSKDAPKGKVGPARAKPDRRRRLGYQEGRELEALPGRIETLEARIASLQGRLADPGLYRREPGAIADLKQELATAESELAVAFERWSELESVDRRL